MTPAIFWSIHCLRLIYPTICEGLPYHRFQGTACMGNSSVIFPGTLGIRLLYWEPGISIDILLAFGNYFHRCIQITEESCYWHHWTLHCLVVVGRRGPWPRVHNVGLSILSPGCKVQEYSPRILHIMYKFSQYAYLIYLIGISLLVTGVYWVIHIVSTLFLPKTVSENLDADA